MSVEKKLTQITWTLAAFEEITYWQGQDKKTLKRINALIKDTFRGPFDGIGKPESFSEVNAIQATFSRPE